MTEEPPQGSDPSHDRDVSLADLGLGAAAAGGGALRAVPDDDAPTRRTPVAEWVMTLAEPLLPPARRAQAEVTMASFVVAHPKWASYWFAGLVGDVLGSLPDDDPWRRLSATLDLSLISLGHRSADGATVLTHRAPGGALPPSETGAVFPDGGRFGALADSLDLVQPVQPNPRVDIGLAGVAEDLGPVPAAIVGLAGAELEEFATTLQSVYHHLWLAQFPDTGTRNAGRYFLDAVAPALRRLTHRRRAYLPGEVDVYVPMTAFAWMSHADNLDAGLPIDPDASLAGDGGLPDGEYAFLTGRG